MKSLIHYKKSYKFPKKLSKFSKFFNLLKFTKQKAGRNHQGKICVWHKGGGHKKLYRPLDFINKKKTSILRKLKTYEKNTIYICKQKKSKKNKISKNFKDLQKLILTSRDCYFKKINKEIILETNDNKHLNVLIPVNGEIYINNNKIKDYIIVDTSIPIKVKIDKNNGYVLIIDILHPNL